METHVNFEIRKEAIFVVGNVLTCISPEYIHELLAHHDGLLKSYLSGLKMTQY